MSETKVYRYTAEAPMTFECHMNNAGAIKGTNEKEEGRVKCPGQN